MVSLILTIIGLVFVSWIFGIILVVSGIMLFQKFDWIDEGIDPEDWEEVGAIAGMGFFWPIVLIGAFFFFLAHVLQFVLKKAVESR